MHMVQEREFVYLEAVKLQKKYCQWLSGSVAKWVRRR